MMYENHMDKTDMLDTQYLFLPRGPGTASLFRMATPQGARRAHEPTRRQTLRA
jgi:hypothetical protein